MKTMALKVFVGLLGAFGAYYTFFLASVGYELYGPNARWCGTPQIWALKGAAVFLAPPAMLGSVGLWFVSRRQELIGIGFSRASKVVLVVLGLCAVANIVICIPAL